MSEPATWRLWLRPQLVALHLILIAALVFCGWMGFWQLGVYDQRQDFERADRQEVPVVPIADVIGPSDSFSPEANYRPVSIRGTFGDPAEQFWVSGQIHEGREGYWFATPFEIEDTQTTFIVVLGWTPERQQTIPLPDGIQEIDVVLMPGGRNTAPMSDDRVIGSVRLPQLLNDLGRPLYSAYGLNTDATHAGDFALIDPPEPESSWTVGARNLVYSFQWWVFGAFALFMWWRMCADAVRAARATETEEPIDAEEPLKETTP